MPKLLAATLLLSAAWAGSPPQFALRDTNGGIHDGGEWRDKKAVVVFFTTTDCPLSNGDVPEMNRVAGDYASRGVAFYAVQADTTIADTEVRKHAAEFGFRFPVLLDPRQVVVKMTGATIMPEAAVRRHRVRSARCSRCGAGRETGGARADPGLRLCD